MAETREKVGLSRCTLCPAGCELALAPAGPEMWKAEYPLTEDAGLCPRGSTLAELLNHRDRIREPVKIVSGRAERIDLATAYREILRAAGGGISFLLDGNIPCRQMATAAAWCGAWPGASLCLVVEPAEREFLAGAEAAEAEYLSQRELAECDGFCVIGDAFAANPISARGILDRRQKQRRTPVVVIDPGAGTAVKFATHRVDCPPCGEYQALLAVAEAAKVDLGRRPDASAPEGMLSSAAAAGRAIAQCKRLGVLVAAEYGRGAAWRQIGYAAARLAGALGGGLAPQTTGANALAAVRMAEKLGAVDLATALSGDRAVVAIGCDVLGMLGRDDLEILAGAAGLPNRTTAAAGIVLPTALPCELGGTYVLSGGRRTAVAPLMSPPAGVPTPAEIVAALAGAAGIQEPQVSSDDPPERLDVEAPSLSCQCDDPQGQVLIMARHACQAGCGSMTGHGSWQGSIQPGPELRISPADAEQAEVENLGLAAVTAGGKSVTARVRLWAGLPDGVVVLSEGSAESRLLSPCTIDADGGEVAAAPVRAEVAPVLAGKEAADE